MIEGEVSCNRARGPCHREPRSLWGWRGPCRLCTTSGFESYRLGFQSEQQPASWGRRWCRPRCTSPSPSSPACRSILPLSSPFFLSIFLLTQITKYCCLFVYRGRGHLLIYIVTYGICGFWKFLLRVFPYFSSYQRFVWPVNAFRVSTLWWTMQKWVCLMHILILVYDMSM